MAKGVDWIEFQSRRSSLPIRGSFFSSRSARRCRWHCESCAEEFLMVPCLKNIFYEVLIARQRSYRRQQICRFQVFPPLTPLFVEMFRTRLRTRYRDLDVFVLSVVGGGGIEVNPGLPAR